MRGNPGAFGETSHQGLGPFKALRLPVGIGDSCAWGHGAGAYGAAADTERHASVLARAWCHRRPFFLDVEARHGGAGCAFTPVDRQSYIETPEFQRCAADLALHAQGWARVEAIRRAFA